LGGDLTQDFTEALFPATPTSSGHLRNSNIKSYLAGPSIYLQLVPRLAMEVTALFKPLRFTDATVLPDGTRRSVSPATVVTWQFPVLAKYRLYDSAFGPFITGGPSFRKSGNLNGTRPSSLGVTVGGGLTIPMRSVSLEPALRYTRWNADRLSPAARTVSNQLEFLIALTTAGYGSNWKPLGSRVSLGAIAGMNLTNRLRDGAVDLPRERRMLSGASVGFDLTDQFSIQGNAIYSPIGLNVTWEFPLLARYKVPVSASQLVSPVFELGPAFRTPQELNDSSLGRYGVAAGGGVEASLGHIRVAPVVRLTRWSSESRPERSRVYLGQVQFLVNVAF
jgi:hypothetical protein